MRYNISVKDNKLILEVVISPYIFKGKRKREIFDTKSALQILKENNYKDYVLEGENQINLDNKFTSNTGTYIFTKKEKKEKPLELDSQLINNNLDISEKSVLQYPKKKKRRKSYSTDE
jgi:hypothetical protein